MSLFTFRNRFRSVHVAIVMATVFSGILLSTTSLRAQSEEEPSDLLEVVFTAGFAAPGGGVSDFGDSLGAKSGLTAGTQIGFFVTPEITVGVDLSYYRLGVDNPNTGDLKHQYYNAMLYGKYFFFGESRLTPFVKLQSGIHTPKYTTVIFDERSSVYRFREQAYDPCFAVGASAGLLMLTSDNGGLFLEAGYQLSFSENAIAEYQSQRFALGENAGLFSLRAGFNVFFGAE